MVMIIPVSIANGGYACYKNGICDSLCMLMQGTKDPSKKWLLEMENG